MCKVCLSYSFVENARRQQLPARHLTVHGSAHATQTHQRSATYFKAIPLAHIIIPHQQFSESKFSILKPIPLSTTAARAKAVEQPA